VLRILDVLLLLLTLGMSVVAVLGSILSMLLGGRGVFLALRMIALAVMLSRSAMRPWSSPIESYRRS
jgi:hypothetical protein